MLCPSVQLLDALFGIANDRRVAFQLRKLQQLAGIAQLPVEFPQCRNRGVEALSFPHKRLRLLRVVPDLWIFGLGVQLVEATWARSQSKMPPQQNDRLLDVFNQLFRLGAHEWPNPLGPQHLAGGLSRCNPLASRQMCHFTCMVTMRERKIHCGFVLTS